MNRRDYEVDITVTLDRDPTDNDVALAERAFAKEWSCTGADKADGQTITLFGNGDTASSTTACHASLVRKLRAAFPRCHVVSCWHELPEPVEHETTAHEEPDARSEARP
ncbi:MAG: hypothetical protein IT379_30275 [Deltaproteobacteria bacterium]|nr:hypothetical protein [Deltaproteobacteria bacterium]